MKIFKKVKNKDYLKILTKWLHFLHQYKISWNEKSCSQQQQQQKTFKVQEALKCSLIYWQVRIWTWYALLVNIFKSLNNKIFLLIAFWDKFGLNTKRHCKMQILTVTAINKNVYCVTGL